VSTDAEPIIDTVVEIAAQDLSGHDFDLPCSITRRGKPCTATAQWWAQFRPHHNNTGVFDSLLCPSHHAFVMSGGAGPCSKCGEPVVFIENLLRLEPIKP
jgi:hypothetical protein